VQHLQFHLLPVEELNKYVRFVIEKAELTIDEESIAMVLRQGGGSARDTLSALELVASGGGEPEGPMHTEEIIRGIIDRDHGAALAAVARAMQQGRDAHTYAQDVVRTMRDCFLSIMSPELVQLPPDRVTELNAYARELGTQRIVRIMETLGSTMVEMRHAPDARLLLEVAVVQLSSPAFDNSQDGVLARLSQLEEAVKQLREHGVAATPPPPINPVTGRAKVGGLARNQDSTGSLPAPDAPPAESKPSEVVAEAGADAGDKLELATLATASGAGVEATSSTGSTGDPMQMWPQVTDAMKGLAKAMFKPAVIESVDGKKITVRLPANTPMKRAQEQIPTVAAALKQVCGGVYVVTLTQADPTSGIQRPVIEDEKPKTIDKVVEEDPYAAIDLNETVIASDAVDPLLEALQSEFPEGAIVEDESSDDQVAKPKSSRGKK
jgi:DNA polymerase-3 subunit gamma/tau